MKLSRLAFALAFALSLSPAGAAEKAEPVTEPETPGVEPELMIPQSGVSLEDIQTFVAVYRAVKDAYVEPVDDKVLMQSAIRGLLTGLDPHSEYLDNEGVEVLDEETTGAYAGVGLEVLMLDGNLRVITPIDDTPADRAGIKPGDIIQRIDGTPVTAQNGEAAVDLLRGEPGSPIQLTITRDGQVDPLSFTLERELIRVASVKARALEPGYGYVRIAQFQQETGKELREKLRRLVAANKGALRGLVLDLRSNPGGLLNAAVEVSDAFLEDGLIVSTQGRIKEADISFSASKGDLIDGAPMIVLVDNGTASAAEIVAGALKGHNRGLVMGTRTFGKGSVQTVLPLSSSAAVKLTTARYYTPSGSIQATGIKPDIELADMKLAPPDSPATPMITERNLSGHLVGEAEAKAGEVVTRDESLATDYALSEALNVLKGLALARERTNAPRVKEG